MYPLLHSNEEKISPKCVRRGLIEFSTMSNGSTRGWRGDIVAILLMGVLSLVPVLLPGPHPFTPGNATLAALDRLFANPASTVENLFYFGFLTERLLYKTKWLTPLLIAAMYTIHEMSNPVRRNAFVIGSTKMRRRMA
jgi:hypothetical protein